MSSRSTLIALVLLLLGLPEAGTADGTVDLHAHLFMNEGTGSLMEVDFNSPLPAGQWNSILQYQINYDTLERSGNAIVVVSLYANPLVEFNPRESIRRQISLAQEFTAIHSGWIIAKTAAEASAAILTGKRVLVLSLERASGILETEADLQEFIDELGIRIVTLLHLTDDLNGGVALLPGWKSVLSPIGLLQSYFHPEPEGGMKINPKGLTHGGRALLSELIRRHIWIDLAHASDQSQADAAPLLEAAGQPLLYTHTSLRHYLDAERGISDEQLRRVGLTGGIIGILPGEEMLAHTSIDPRFCPSSCRGNCSGSVSALATQFSRAADVLVSESIMLGSDLNGFTSHLKPDCAMQPEFDSRGFWNMGQTKNLWSTLERIGARARTEDSIRAFLRAWGRL